jgi:hypothetical protein
MASLQETNNEMETKIKQLQRQNDLARNHLVLDAGHLQIQKSKHTVYLKFDLWLNNHKRFLILLLEAKSNLFSGKCPTSEKSAGLRILQI